MEIGRKPEIWKGRPVERNFGALADSLLEQTKPEEREGVTKALHRLSGSQPEDLEGRSPKFDHLFRCHLKLLYPDNALIVLPDAPPPSAGTGRFRSIGDALQYVHEQALSGKCRQFSIAIAEGDYDDDLILPWKNSPPPGLEIEICGIGAVKVMYRKNFLSVLGKQKITLRNFTILDYRRLQHSDKDNSLVDILAGGVVHLIKIKTESEFAYSQEFKQAVYRKINEPELVRAPLFSISLNSKMILTDCEINDGFIGAQLNSSIQATKTKFNKAQFKATSNSTLLFTSCEFRGRGSSESGSDTRSSSMAVAPTSSPAEPKGESGSLMQVRCGVSIILKDSVMENWPTIIYMSQRGTSAIVENCAVNCPDKTIAFIVILNADARFVGNRFSAHYLLAMQMNTEGKVEFRSNEMIPAGEQARFALDEQSKLSFHDFDAPKFQVSEFFQCQRPHAKERSGRNEALKVMMKMGGDYVGLRSRILDKGFEKKCERCDLTEILWAMTRKRAVALGFEEALIRATGGAEHTSTESKFKHCSTCKSVCYCSRACQKDDWKDHKTVCAKYAEAQKMKKKDAR